MFSLSMSFFCRKNYFHCQQCQQTLKKQMVQQCQQTLKRATQRRYTKAPFVPLTHCFELFGVDQVGDVI